MTSHVIGAAPAGQVGVSHAGSPDQADQESYDPFAGLGVNRRLVELACRGELPAAAEAADIATKAVLGGWPLTPSDTAQVMISEVIRIYAVVSAIDGGKRNPSRKLSEAQRAVRLRAKRFDAAIKSAFDVVVEDLQAELPYRLTATLGRSELRNLVRALQDAYAIVSLAVAQRDAILKPERKTGAPKKYWDRLIKELDKFYTAAGGSSCAAPFTRSIAAMFAALGDSHVTRGGIEKRIRRALAAPQQQTK